MAMTFVIIFIVVDKQEVIFRRKAWIFARSHNKARIVVQGVIVRCRYGDHVPQVTVTMPRVAENPNPPEEFKAFSNCVFVVLNFRERKIKTGQIASLKQQKMTEHVLKKSIQHSVM